MQASTNTEREAARVAMREGQQSWLARPGTLLRIEGGVLLAMSVLLYWVNGGSWALFGLLILAPDVSMLGYLLGAKVGTASYNSVHNYALPAGLVAFGVMGGSLLAVSVALVWFAHIGMDRLVGYGLKYTSGFKDTHLDRV
jgi:hypothetical protein